MGWNSFIMAKKKLDAGQNRQNPLVPNKNLPLLPPFLRLLRFDVGGGADPSLTQVREPRPPTVGRLPPSHVPPQVKDLLRLLGRCQIFCVDTFVFLEAYSRERR